MIYFNRNDICKCVAQPQQQQQQNTKFMNINDIKSNYLEFKGEQFKPKNERKKYEKKK